ncbi:MAG TPA: type II toxin-antitoxin system HicA family toxin [Chloroflexota bacterium]|nr:type II toxin-antitoxin system HicA family toxin [Chloroflexota bacterium]
MPPFALVKRDDLIRALRKAGFAGPFGRGHHGIMIRAGRRVAIPNPHGSDIGRGSCLARS